MARFRLAGPAQADLANILAASAERWGTEGRRRCAILLAAAMRIIAADPEGPLTHTRQELLPRLRFFICGMPAACSAGEGEKAGAVLYYRALQPGLIEIVRVLRERTEPSRHFDTVAEDKT